MIDNVWLPLARRGLLSRPLPKSFVTAPGENWFCPMFCGIQTAKVRIICKLNAMNVNYFLTRIDESAVF